jgi:hypothetical protein
VKLVYLKKMPVCADNLIGFRHFLEAVSSGELGARRHSHSDAACREREATDEDRFAQTGSFCH